MASLLDANKVGHSTHFLGENVHRSSWPAGYWKEFFVKILCALLCYYWCVQFYEIYALRNLCLFCFFPLFVGAVVGIEVDGERVGADVGNIVGCPVGDLVGLLVGMDVGFLVGSLVTLGVGLLLGLVVGWLVGIFVGPLVGTVVGFRVGTEVGVFVGSDVGEVVGLVLSFSSEQEISIHQPSFPK